MIIYIYKESSLIKRKKNFISLFVFNGFNHIYSCFNITCYVINMKFDKKEDKIFYYIFCW